MIFENIFEAIFHMVKFKKFYLLLFSDNKSFNMSAFEDTSS